MALRHENRVRRVSGRLETRELRAAGETDGNGGTTGDWIRRRTCEIYARRRASSQGAVFDRMHSEIELLFPGAVRG